MSDDRGEGTLYRYDPTKGNFGLYMRGAKKAIDEDAPRIRKEKGGFNLGQLEALEAMQTWYKIVKDSKVENEDAQNKLEAAFKDWLMATNSVSLSVSPEPEEERKDIKGKGVKR